MRLDVLDHGYVDRVSWMGGDLAVANAARISHGHYHTELSAADENLIAHLIRAGHGTPFEHSVFTFRVKAPIFVARQWMRHRMASYNEHSARYSEMSPEFYAPKDDNRIRVISERAYDEYRTMLDQGVPKERARLVLPVNIYTVFWFTVNSRSLMNFLALRRSEHAQAEIREYARALEDLWTATMPVTAKAFNDLGRVAP